MLSKLDTRTVLRITLIKNWNDSKQMIPSFTEMFDRSNPHFIEIKSYMHIGRSTNRLEHENMLDMSEIRDFATGVSQYSNRFSIMDESEISRIVILQNKERFTDRYLSAYSETN